MTLDEAKEILKSEISDGFKPNSQAALAAVLYEMRSYQLGAETLLELAAKANERMRLARRHLRQARMVNTLDGARDYAALAYRALDGRRR